jgi:hypothetical protein
VWITDPSHSKDQILKPFEREERQETMKVWNAGIQRDRHTQTLVKRLSSHYQNYEHKVTTYNLTGWGLKPFWLFTKIAWSKFIV